MRLAAGALCAIVLLGAAPEPPPPADVVVPIVSDGDHLFAEVSVDGSAPLRFAVDTSGGEIIDDAVAERIGLRRGRTIRVRGVGNTAESGWLTTVSHLRIGNARLDDVSFIAMPVTNGFGVAEGGHVDGLIGPALLSQFTVTIDAARGTMTLGRRGSGPLGDVPLSNRGGHPTIPCAVESVETRCQLDTGSRLAVTLLGPFIAAHTDVAARPLTAVGVDGYGIGGAARGRLGYVGLTLAGHALRVVGDWTTQQSGAFAANDVGANVGERVLGRFVVTYDLARGRARFVPNAALGAPDRVDRSGLFLVRRDGVTTVLDVRRNTPAAAAGIRPGDVIEAVEGKPAASLTLSAIRAQLSDPATSAVTLRVGPAGETRDVAVALADYVPRAADATAATTAGSSGTSAM